MAGSVVHSTNDSQVRLPDHASRMAKAEVRKTDPDPRQLVGKAIQQARSLVGWSLKEFAFKFKRDERLVARWESGEDRPPFDELLFHEELGMPLAVHLGLMAGLEVTYTMQAPMRRRA